jgi:hypothetical protein
MYGHWTFHTLAWHFICTVRDYGAHPRATTNKGQRPVGFTTKGIITRSLRRQNPFSDPRGYVFGNVRHRLGTRARV